MWKVRVQYESVRVKPPDKRHLAVSAPCKLTEEVENPCEYAICVVACFKKSSELVVGAESMGGDVENETSGVGNECHVCELWAFQ